MVQHAPMTMSYRLMLLISWSFEISVVSSMNLIALLSVQDGVTISRIVEEVDPCGRGLK